MWHSRFQKAPEVIRGEGESEFKGVKVRGIPSFHDPSGGSERGTNTLFLIEMDGIRVLHLGDLGALLDKNQIEAVSPVDVLLVPVGGTYTVDAKAATEIMETLKPKITIPMHYKTEYLDFPIAPVDNFLRGKEKVRRENEIELTRETLSGEPEIVVLEIPDASATGGA